ncbi:clotting factor C isoform X2 [Solenopsis invicta]|uniref:clotting factor C isoform X2 n=1 Tax=Solenopsis invicta TaxID=13686 RepID=UPI00193D7BDC|nr:clotting factor C isoform X2 [Solenopsis invicta]
MLEQRYVRRRGLQLIKLRTVCLNMRIVRQISTLLIIYGYGVCIDGLLCIGATNCTDRSNENSKLCSRIGWPSFLKLVRPPMETIRPPPVQISRRIRSPVTSSSNTCKVPPQPQNGQWKLHPDQCPGEQECNVAQRTELGLGSLLVYSCYTGFKIRGSPYVSCIIGGKWINIPDCVPDIRCKPLSTASVDATCTYDDEWVSCGSSVRPGTKATLKCRNSYRPENNPFSRQRNNVRCNANGQWEPEPMRCIPECGIIPRDFVPLIVSGNQPNITEIPWHASLYRNVDKQKQFFCGATVIKENLLITAANCVYNEKTRKLVQAKSIYVLTGNIYRDYDYPSHDQRHVNKNQVKRIYIRRSYLGLVRNYLWDIAILELVTPFVLSTWLVPVCIDIISDSSVLKVGSSGKVARFGRTHGESSMVLQALTVPVISFSQCSQQFETEQFITVDKFCTGYTNGSGICDGDSGGGLVFKTNNLWYLRGIVSLSFDRIQKRRDVYCYYYNLHSLYTNVSSHISWIQDVITKIEQNQIQILCSSESQTKCSYFDNKYSLLYELGFF